LQKGLGQLGETTKATALLSAPAWEERSAQGGEVFFDLALGRFAVPVRRTVAVIFSEPGPRWIDAALPARKKSSP